MSDSTWLVLGTLQLLTLNLARTVTKKYHIFVMSKLLRFGYWMILLLALNLMVFGTRVSWTISFIGAMHVIVAFFALTEEPRK